MHARPATADDVPALAALQVRWDTHWLGAPENDESELRSTFDRGDPLAERSRGGVGPGGGRAATAGSCSGPRGGRAPTPSCWWNRPPTQPRCTTSCCFGCAPAAPG